MEKPVVFRNQRGKQLVGIFHLPDGRDKFPLVVFCHGFGGTKTDRKFIKLARALAKNKIASFRFDFEGCGDSEGNMEAITVKREMSDLDSALKSILKERNIDKDRIAFLGYSLGSAISSLYLARTNLSVRALVFWAPALNQKELLPVWQTASDLRKWQKQGYLIRKDKKMGISFLKENRNKDYSPTLSQVKAPILIIHGQKDDTVPIKFSKQLANKYKNIKMISLPKTDHKFEDYELQEKLIKETLKWFRQCL